MPTKQKIIYKKPRIPKAWVIAVDMGYGHQRTAYPLKHLAPNSKVVNANHYEGAPKKDVKIWDSSRRIYEFLSKFKRIPIIGQFAFKILDKFQKIMEFYPKRDLSKPNFSLRQTFSAIKKGWGKNLIEQLKAKNGKLPFLSTFFIPAFMAEQFNYPGEIFVTVCDADIARPWAHFYPLQSRIKYFTPNQRTTERLKLYGVKQENIFQTGFPLPKENIGTEKMEILKKDMGFRILNLDPSGTYRKNYQTLLKKHLGELPKKPNHVLTIMFSIGGAGAQTEIAEKILKSLNKEIQAEKIKLILAVGTKQEVKNSFLKKIENIGMKNLLGQSIEIISHSDIQQYFTLFNQALRKTDIFWTKPSELSFYTALGLPIVIAPPIGSQEDFNKEWLLELGSGITQKNPKFTYQWLFDLLENGWFAEAAMDGFIEAEKLGTYNIEKIIQGIK